MTRDDRIQEYANRKGKTWKEASDYLIDFALDVIEARRKGGIRVGNRPQQKKVLARARQQRAQKEPQS